MPDRAVTIEKPREPAIPLSAAAQRQQKNAAFQAMMRFAVFATMVIGVTVLQKIGFGPNSDTIVPVIIPMILLGIGALVVAIRPAINPIRLGLFLLFAVMSVVSTGAFAPRYSMPSLALYLVLYLPMVFSFEIEEEEYKKYLNFFSNVMVGMAAIEFAQHLIQIVLTWQYWPNLNALLPEQALIPFFNYIQPVVWGMPYMKPNAIFFLEVSLLSQFLTLALAAEVVFFRRTWRMALFTAALFASFAGTGLLLLVITLPVLLGRAKMRTVVLVLIGIGLVAGLAYGLGWFELVERRLGEFNKAGSSGNMRFIYPFERMVEFMDMPGSAYSGIGAGQIEKADNFQFWPIAKAVLEYGVIPGVTFYAFFLYAMFDRPVSKRLAFTLVVWFSLEGALLTAVNPITCIILSSMFVAPRQNRKATAARPARLTEQPKPDLPVATDTPTTAKSASSRRRSSRDLAASTLAKSVLPDGRVDTAAACGHPQTDGRRIYAIGDIHGRADLLSRMLEHIFIETRDNPPADGQRPVLVFLGDYIDRGPQSRAVMDYIIEASRLEEFEAHCLIGNHEDALLDFLDKNSLGAAWGRYGGMATLQSYGVAPPDPADDRAEWNRAREQMQAAMPKDHVDFLRSLTTYYEIGDLLFVHAGVRPGVDLSEQSRRDLLYIRTEFLDSVVDGGRVVVHGHTPSDRAYGAPGRLCLDSGAYASGMLTAARFEPGQAPDILEARANGVKMIRSAA